MGSRRRSAPTAIGVDLHDDGGHLAMVEPGRGTIVGLGTAPYPPGTVVGGDVRRPDLAGAAIQAVLDRVHWATPPDVAVVVNPTAASGDRARISTPVLGPWEMGQVAVAAEHVDRALATIGRTSARAGAVDCAPVAAARFLDQAEPGSTLRFVRGGSARVRWTMCWTPETVEIEVDDTPDEFAAQGGGIVVGASLSNLAAAQWGRLDRSRPVRRSMAAPERWTVAVGAAFGLVGHRPQIDLAGGDAVRTDIELGGSGWGMEAVR
ncbi:MAG: hypothetical protein AAF547_03705 [Actinomycetota bacterium]